MKLYFGKNLIYFLIKNEISEFKFSHTTDTVFNNSIQYLNNSKTWNFFFAESWNITSI